MRLGTLRNKDSPHTLRCQWKSGKSKLRLDNFSYIKDYDGGTLMEAYCNPMIDYTNLSDIIKEQKKAIMNLAADFLNVKHRNSFSDLEKILKKQRMEVNWF